MKQRFVLSTLLVVLMIATLAGSAAMAQEEMQLIRNGNFFGVSEWSFGGACAIWRQGAGPVNEWVEVLVPRCGGNIELMQMDIALESDTVYRLDFLAESMFGHDVSVMVEGVAAPHANYGLDAVCDLQEAAAATEGAWQQCSVTFQASGLDEASAGARVRFWLTPYATADDLYRFDRVSLQPVQEAGDLNQCVCQ